MRNCLVLIGIFMLFFSACTIKTTDISSVQKMTYWMGNAEFDDSNMMDFNDTPFAKELIRRTGINVEFVQPLPGTEVEQLNILISSDQLPDMIEYRWSDYYGGSDKIIRDGYIITLDGLIQKSSPNIREYFKNNPMIDKMSKNTMGNYYMYPFVHDSDNLCTYKGIAVRYDWLEQCGLSVPQTIDDWYEVLKAFRDRFHCTAPLTFTIEDLMETNAFMGAYHVASSFYAGGGGVKFGPFEEGYRSFLTTFAKWYAEGLIDIAFSTADKAHVRQNLLTQKSGAVVTDLAGLNLSDQMLLTGTPYPALHKGDTPEFGQRDTRVSRISGTAISSNCSDIELAAKFLDYGYSPEGIKFYNSGIQGDGTGSAKPDYNFRRFENGPFIQTQSFFKTFYSSENQKASASLWSRTGAAATTLPLVTYTIDEGNSISRLKSEIDDYVQDMTIQFIMGIRPISEFSLYQAKLSELDLNALLDINNSAYKRYNGKFN